MTGLAAYGKRLLKRIRSLQKEVCKDPSIEKVHALRVAVKQFNALLCMVSYCLKLHDRKHFKRLRKLFRAAGTMREWQLLQEKLQATPYYLELKLHLKKNEVMAYQSFLHQCKRTDRGFYKKAGKYVSINFMNIREDNMVRYFEFMQFKMEQAWNGQDRTLEILHRLRMMVKEFRYNYTAMVDECRILLPLQPDIKLLNDCDRLLGSWHDFEVMAIQLNQLLQNTGLSTRARLMLLQQKKEAESQAEKKLIRLSNDMDQLKL